MKPFVLNLIDCPLTGQPLELITFDVVDVELSRDEKLKIQDSGFSLPDFNKEILQGLLINKESKWMYPVYKGVPRLLVFKHPLLKVFQKDFASQIQAYIQAGFMFPDDRSIPGETNVLKSFSAEWTDYDYNEDVYWGQSTKVYNESLLSTLEHPEHNLTNKLVLEVGIGSGGSANYLCNHFSSLSLGVDLGYSVDVAFKNFSKNPFFHIVQASVFHLPFPESKFDFVYSHGVIHHTFNTRLAFDKLSKVVKPHGRLYLWVYSFLNESRTMKRKVIMVLERLIRPWCSRLPGWVQTIVLTPITPLYIFHQNSIHYKSKTGMAKYNWREALHAARDRFTPKYIHRHSEEEVMGWYKEKKFNRVVPLSQKKLPDFVPEGFYMNTGVEGFKS